MRHLAIIAILLWTSIAFSQVGIGTTTPSATLDIPSSNVSNPTNTDGILIPRIDNFPSTDPTSAQDGMLVFVTGDGTPAQGFYFWNHSSTAWTAIGGGSQNTLDQAYDQGGAGAGRSITADNGAVTIVGSDGFNTTGTFGSGASIGTPGSGTRMSFNPNTASFRSGFVDGDQWDVSNTGQYSAAFNANTTALASHSTVLGRWNVVTGTTNSWVSTDPLFVVGNGTNNTNRSNAFIVEKDGRTGVGIDNPASALHVGISTSFDLAVTNSGQDGLYLEGSRDNSGINTIGSSIGFGPPANTRAVQRKAAIASVQTGVDTDHIGLAFYTHNTTINLADMVEAMRLNHSGNLGLNNTDPSATLDVVGSFQYDDGNQAAGYVLSSDANGNASWTDPALTEVDGDVTNEIQDLSVSGTDLNISDGGASASLLAFVNPLYPDGMAGMEGVIHTFSSSYTVPAGKNLYITHVYNPSSLSTLSVGGLQILSGQLNVSSFQSLTKPIVVGAGQVITNVTTSARINGFLADATVTPLTQNSSSYTVPAGQMLVVLNCKRSSGTGTVTASIDGLTIYQGNGTSNGTAGLSDAFQPLFIDSGSAFRVASGNWNGYLITK